MGNLTKNYSRSEFACKCGCGEGKMDLDFVNDLQRLHDLLYLRYDGNRIIGIITSGIRCEKHNKSVGGAEKSFHMPYVVRERSRLVMASDIQHKVVRGDGSVEIIPSFIVARVALLATLVGLAWFKGIGCYAFPFRCHFDSRKDHLATWVKQDNGAYSFGTDFTNIEFA